MSDVDRYLEKGTAELSALDKVQLLQFTLEIQNQLRTVSADYAAFAEAQKELDLMYDGELADMKKKIRQQEDTIRRLETEMDRVKSRYHEEKQEMLKIESDLRSKLADSNKIMAENSKRIRQLEQQTDDLERAHRNNEQLSVDLSEQLNKAVERAALLESEVALRQISAEELLHLKEVREEQKERPRLMVEPLRPVRHEETPDEPTPDKSMIVDDERLTSGKDITCSPEPSEIINETSALNATSFSTPATTSAKVASCVNRMMKEMIDKVDRLENLLGRLKSARA